MTRLAILAVVLVLPCSHLLAAEPSAKVQARALEEHMQKVIEDATPSVVAIVVSSAKYPLVPAEKLVPGKLGRYEPGRGVDRFDLSDPANVANHQFGSGIVLDATRGLILTTYHLIDGATKIYVRTSSGKGSYADIHAADARSDLAVLRLIDRTAGMAASTFATVRLVDTPDGGKPNLKRGSWVIALGHPLAAGVGDGQPTASWGILGNIRRRSVKTPRTEFSDSLPIPQYGSLLQTDARVALGGSGSALLNMDGELIGIASAVAAVSGSEASGGFAMPFDANYRRIIEVLKKGQEVEYGFLGVSMSPERGTVTIENVTAGCPAHQSDLHPGDVIKAVDGNPLVEQDDLLLHIGGALAGTPSTLTIRRGGEVFTKTITLAKMKNTLPSFASVPPPSIQGLRVDYTSIGLVSLLKGGVQLRTMPPVGVAVRDLEPNSIAEKRFKEAGDGVQNWFITRVDGTAVTQPSDFHKAVEGKATVKFTLVNPLVPTQTKTITLP